MVASSNTANAPIENIERSSVNVVINADSLFFIDLPFRSSEKFFPYAYFDEVAITPAAFFGQLIFPNGNSGSVQIMNAPLPSLNIL